MKFKLSGSLLIETLVATAIVAFLAVLVYTSFLEVTRWGVRNRMSGIGLNILASHIEKDATLPYNSTLLTASTKQYTQTSVGYEDLNQLPNAVLTQVITDGNNVKTIQYILEWSQNNKVQRVSTDFQITAGGVLND